jgi:hypothetical protein
MLQAGCEVHASALKAPALIAPFHVVRHSLARSCLACLLLRLPVCPHALPPCHPPTHPPAHPQSQYIIQQRNVTHLEAHATGVKEEEI